MRYRVAVAEHMNFTRATEACFVTHSTLSAGLKELARVRGAGTAPDGLEATSLLTLVQMVDAGLGLALVPGMALRGSLLDGTGLEARRLAAPAPARSIALAARQSSARVAEFGALSECLAALGKSTAPPARAKRKGSSMSGT